MVIKTHDMRVRCLQRPTQRRYEGFSSGELRFIKTRQNTVVSLPLSCHRYYHPSLTVELELVVCFLKYLQWVSSSDQIGRLLRDHGDGGVRVAGCHGRHHGGVDHSQTLHEVDPVATQVTYPSCNILPSNKVRQTNSIVAE